MRAGSWHPGRAAELAEAWDCSPSYVRRLAAEASRQLADPVDPGEAKARVEQLVAEALDMARDATDPARGAQVLLKAAEVLARLHGLTQPRPAPAPPAPAGGPTGPGGEEPFGFTREPQR